MTQRNTSLTGYAFPIHKRDGFVCRYCGLDGKMSFENWLTLSQDHLLPKGHPDRDNSDYIVTACAFCNVAENRYFESAAKRSLNFEGLSPNELVAQRRPYVLAVRNRYREFWEKEVNQSGNGSTDVSEEHRATAGPRGHLAFLNSYADSDEGLYDDLNRD